MKDGKFEVGDVVQGAGVVNHIPSPSPDNLLGCIYVHWYGSHCEDRCFIDPDAVTHMGSERTLPYNCVVTERDKAMGALKDADETLEWVVEKFVKPVIDSEDEFSVGEIVRNMKHLVKSKVEALLFP